MDDLDEQIKSLQKPAYQIYALVFIIVVSIIAFGAFWMYGMNVILSQNNG